MMMYKLWFLSLSAGTHNETQKEPKENIPVSFDHPYFV